MATRARWFLADLLWLIALCAVILAATRSLPHRHGTLFPIAAVLNELVFVGVCLALLRTVGHRSRYDFTVGFAIFSILNLLFRVELAVPFLHEVTPVLHTSLLEHWAEAALWDNTGNFRFGLTDDGTARSILVRSAETPLLGTIGGLWSMWVERRRCRPAGGTTAPADRPERNIRS